MPTQHPQYDRIVSNPETLDGQPCIRGHRLTVRRVLMVLATYGGDLTEIRKDYDLEEEDIRQALAYAAENLDECVLVSRRAS